MKTNSAYSYLGVLFLIAFLSACVKDTDFDQANDIIVPPIVELDLIYFDLPAITFYDTIASSPILTVNDTTALPFLNDEEIHRNLKRAEFYYKVTNSIQREFQVVFEFLDEQNVLRYATEMTVNQGSVENAIVTEYIDNVEGSALRGLTTAEKVAVSVTIPTSNENLDGTIKLESKTTYHFEF
jgi:hypothetical protein